MQDTPRQQAGHLLRAARQKKGWSAVHLAEELTQMLDRETVSQSTISHWETGKSAPRWEKHQAIEEVLGLELGIINDVLLGRPRVIQPPSDDDTQFSLISDAWSELSEDDRSTFVYLAQRLSRSA